jgi:YD repeat-containing protein
VTNCGGTSTDNTSISLSSSLVVDIDRRQQKPCACGVGNPIYPALGVKHEDLDTGIGLRRLPLTLSYDSAKRVAFVSGSAPVPPDPSVAILGDLWSLSLQRRLEVQGASGAAGALLWRGDGRAVSLSAAATGGALVGTADIVDKLVAVRGGYIFYDFSQNSQEVYDVAGKLSSIHWADGATATFSYVTTMLGTLEGPSVLSSVQDANGRQLALTYDTSGRLAQLTDPAGQSLLLGYSNAGMLSTITWPDTTAKTYAYDTAAYPWALTGVLDELSQRFATFGYDANGMAISTEHAGATNKYVASWTSAPGIAITEILDTKSSVTYRYHDWAAPQGLSYTGPQSDANPLTTTTILGNTYLTSHGQPGGPGYSASVSTSAFDSHGNRVTETDSNGNRSCSAYDISRNLRIVTLEGLATSKSCPSDLAPSAADGMHPERKTTTTWHPDWVLKAREAEPKKITTWVYNGQADPITATTASCVAPATTLPDGKPLAVLCTRYEQATSDATGALGLSASIAGATRAWSYTYNQYGRVLTETTPKQSPTDVLSHTTTYVYYPTTSFSGSVGHTLGDLNTVTNPLGHVTTFTAYDKAGRLLSSKDANATVTAMTYWPRGWLHTQTVTPALGSALNMTYDYWATGLIKTVTMPDSSTLNYVYDNAHRLTDVTDAAGNKVHYVLDNTGNRTSEQVSDASGQLASSISRVYDQLNRVQSTTGALH